MTSADDLQQGEFPLCTDELVTAGRFSALTLLSAKALRIYADRALLSPARVDPVNGYRYYASDQVRTGWLIGLLRGAGLSLEEIGQIIRSDTDSALRHLRQSAAASQRRAEVAQALLERARLHLSQEASMSQVSTILEVDRPILSVLRRMSPAEMETVVPGQLRRLRDAAVAAGLVVTGDPFGIFHAPVTEDSDGPLEIALPVDGLADTEGGIRSYRLPGGLVATRYAVGPETWFPDVLALYDEVHTWITQTGRTPVGPPREVWHNAPNDPEPLRFTITWPYATPPS